VAGFVSGVDWSEDVVTSRLVVAIVHVASDELAVLESELAEARRRLGRGDRYAFKHLEANDDIHTRFYAAIGRVQNLRAHVLVCDRSSWVLQHVKTRRGDPCVCDTITALALLCPESVVADQTLYIDLPRRELPVVDAYRTAIRKSMRQADRRSFGHISPRPDDRLESGIVQAADMIAGEVREQLGLDGPYLPRLGSRIRVF
jgi:hypothetical protein